MFYIKIPRERIGVLIGPKGDTKKRIEIETGVKIHIDSNTGDITIDETKAKDPSTGLKARDITRAIARGFPPQKTFKLLDDDIYLKLIDIRDHVGKRPKHIKRMKARLIGTNGKTRRIIEDLTSTDISIYGNTIGILGGVLGLEIARRAIEMILGGSEHSTVYRFLESKRRDIKMARMGMR